jgi:hypothetical protein
MHFLILSSMLKLMMTYIWGQVGKCETFWYLLLFSSIVLEINFRSTVPYKSHCCLSIYLQIVFQLFWRKSVLTLKLILDAWKRDQFSLIQSSNGKFIFLFCFAMDISKHYNLYINHTTFFFIRWFESWSYYI